jgi:geranylgeranyl diphosphate synthase type I
VIKALEMADKKERRFLLQVLGNKPSKKKLEAATDLLKRCGAVDYASRKAAELVDEAVEKLRVLPDSEAKAALESLADFVIKREF